MPLQITPAKIKDVHRIAEIHLAAFNSNPLLHVQFPSPSSLHALRDVLARDMRRVIEAGEERSEKVVVVVRNEDGDGGEIVSFARWELPRSVHGESDVENEVSWPEDCQVEYLDRYHQLAEAMRRRVMGDRICYRMTFVGTDPKYRQKGAATLLIKWGLERAKQERMPVYLEATMEARSIYLKLGFVVCDELELPLPGTDENGKENVYRELGMLREV